MAAAEKQSRTRRDPSQIAQAELDKAQKRLERAEVRVEALTEDLHEAREEAARAQRYVEFAKMNPDLPAQAEPMPVDGTNAAE